MNRNFINVVIQTLIAAIILFCGEYAMASEPEKESGYYIFCYFMNNGEDGVHLALSRDGYNWKAVNGNKSILPPPLGKNLKLTRDPSITYGKDGIFRLVWTVSWDGRSFGYAQSNDLINWSNFEIVPSMDAEPTTRNTWAPEVYYDSDSQLFYVLWSSTIPGRFSPADKGTSEDAYDHRVYYLTTKDFKSYSPTQLYFNPGHNVIDAFLAKCCNTYYLFYKDETLVPEAKKNILVATAPTPTGPFSPGKVISAENWVEGPSMISINGEMLVYYDCYTKGKYGAVRTKDGKNWEDVSHLISFPQGTRHGTAFEVQREIYEGLVEKYGL